MAKWYISFLKMNVDSQNEELIKVIFGEKNPVFILTTIRPWFQLKRDLARPACDQYQRLGIEPITFADLAVLQGRR
ncbi:hypothetical protein PS664_00712 [Pseudomonas fluorescens]|nr:hypothetical protein PS664_00712 [Pseudomonas fluorescens]